MKRLSDYEDEELFDVLINICEPFSNIFSDKQITEIWKNNGKLATAIYFLKTYKKETLQILKAIDNTPVNINTAVERVQNTIDDFINIPGVMDFLKRAGLMKDVSELFGSAMVNTEAKGQ